MTPDLTRVLKDVRSYFDGDSDVPKCQWPFDRYLNILETSFPDWSIENCTDFNYEYCNTYRIFKTCTREFPVQPEIMLYISCISNVYDFTVGNRRLQNRHFVALSEMNFTQKYGLWISRLHHLFYSLGFIQMQTEWYGYVVPEIQTQLCKKPTLERCLFQDRE